MAEWINAGLAFCDVHKKVEPLERRAKECEDKRIESQKKLDEVHKSLESFEKENARL